VRILQVLKTTLFRWFEQQMATHAAALAFYTLFALAPVVLGTVFVGGRFLGDEFVRMEALTIVGEYISPAAARTLEPVLADWKAPELRIGAGLVALGTLLFAATAFFMQLHESLNIVWQVEQRRSILVGTLYRRLFSFVMVLVSGLVLLVLFAVQTALGAFDALLRDRLDLPVRTLGIVNFATSLVIVALLLAALFHFVPDTRVRWRDALVGGLATALLFEGGKWLIAHYLRVARIASIYSAAGSLVITLLWVYYVSLIILLGAEFTYAWGERRGEEAQGHKT
jgi:membrane protein